MLPFGEKVHKRINLASMILSAIAVAAYFLLDVTKPDSIAPAALFGVGLLIIIFIYGFAFNKLYKKAPKLALGILFFLLSIFSLFLVDFLGGPLTPYLLIPYTVTVLLFIFSLGYGLTTMTLVGIYVGFLSFMDPINTLQIAVILTSLAIVSVFFAFLGIRYRKALAANVELEKSKSDLASNENKEAALLSNIADGVYVVDMERNLTMFNQAAGEMTGWKENEAIGLKCWTVMNLKNETDVSVCQKDCPAMAVWNTGESVLREDTCFVKKRGSKKTQLSSSYSPIKDKNGKLTGAICVFRDITTQKEVDRLRSEFVSTTSHELRTPITAIEGYLELIEDQKICEIDEKAREYSEKARLTAVNMSTLVKNLLTVTKIEEGKVQTNKTNFSIRDLAAEVVEAMTPDAKTRNLYLKIVEPPSQIIKGEKTIGRSLNVTADREQIREVLYNIIENGLKFTSEGGISVSIAYDNDYATVEIADTGVGISADGQKHLFEKFYRVDSTATREVGGTGLGLFITRSIVELFGGSIWVESQVGKGTKFYFTIPRSLD